MHYYNGYYWLIYEYHHCPYNAPHAARRIYNGFANELSNLRWDNNGNLAQQTVYYFVLYLLRDKLNKKFVFTIEE